MRSLLTILAAGLSVLPAATALGRAYVRNNCNFDVSVWSVGSSISGPYRLGKNGGFYAETFAKDPVTGGKALKVTIPADGLFTGAPQTIFAYNLDGDKVWYDLSDIFGDAFSGYKVVEYSAESTCQPIVWGNGVPPGGSQVKVCTSSKDVSLILCAGSGGGSW
jgi:hypothetical protein